MFAQRTPTAFPWVLPLAPPSPPTAGGEWYGPGAPQPPLPSPSRSGARPPGADAELARAPSGARVGEPVTPGLPGDVQPSPAGPPRPGRLGFSDNIRIRPANLDSMPGALKFL
ncbi:hypothetical protein R6Z07F_014402 [Ovis aries]